jgi:hypothetical protein
MEATNQNLSEQLNEEVVLMTAHSNQGATQSTE